MSCLCACRVARGFVIVVCYDGGSGSGFAISARILQFREASETDGIRSVLRPCSTWCWPVSRYGTIGRAYFLGSFFFFGGGGSFFFFAFPWFFLGKQQFPYVLDGFGVIFLGFPTKKTCFLLFLGFS